VSERYKALADAESATISEQKHINLLKTFSRESAPLKTSSSTMGFVEDLDVARNPDVVVVFANTIIAIVEVLLAVVVRVVLVEVEVLKATGSTCTLSKPIKDATPTSSGATKDVVALITSSMNDFDRKLAAT